MRWSSSFLALALVASLTHAGAQSLGPPAGVGTPSGSAGGGLAGTYPNPTVASVPVSALPAFTGDCTTTAGTVATNCLKTNGVTFGPAATAVAGQIPGTATNDSASAGNVGEFISSFLPPGSAISLSTGVAVNVTSITLTPGDWDVFGTVEFKGNAATTVAYVQGAASTTSANYAEPNIFSLFLNSALPFGSITFIAFPIPEQRISLSTPTTVFLVATGGFAINTMSAYGQIQARRRR